MSLVKLTLRPPPNIEFVQGYPGIPPGAPDRPQAAVKGAIEVRVAPQGVKAKWVRIELKKIETLPGGGVANTYFDFVGQSPINVWQSSEEYGILHTQDFPFYIRIPESIPPSIALEKGAGIKYELIATICIKGKRGLLRRDKPTVTSVISPIIIDKHELHSTWPVYQQPDTRTHSEGGVTLTVDRSRTCYGPGDRVSVSATVRADTGTLRGYEFTLRESTVFRAGAHLSGKKAAPVVKVAHIGEQKVPVNVVLSGGAQHKAELAVTIPSDHTTATLNAARHIDITYTLVVKVLMDNGQHVTLELPLIVSNWPRGVSLEAMKRIGMAPNVCLPGQSGTTQPITESIVQAIPSHPYASSEVDIVISRRSTGHYNTAPADGGNATIGGSGPDEFGVNHSESGREMSNDQSSITASTEKSSGYGIQTIGGAQGISSRIAPYAGETTSFARQRASSARAQSARLTVANLNEKEAQEHTQIDHQSSTSPQANRPSTAQSTDSTARSRWMTAEEEKRRLYETAVANVERTRGISYSTTTNRPSTPPASAASTTQNTAMVSPPKHRWPTADEEKAMLFQRAQAAVARVQGLDNGIQASPTSLHHRSNSTSSQQAPTPSSNASFPDGTSNAAAGSSSSAPTTKPQATHYLSADDEKAALRRYYEAKAAVDRTHSAAYGSAPQSTPSTSVPTAYDALYPSHPTSPAAAGSSPTDSPPPFVSSSSDLSYLSEKERVRRAFEARDAAELAIRSASVPNPNTAGFQVLSTAQSQPVPSSPTPSQAMPNAFAEKEMLRRRFEAQDAAALGVGGTPTPPVRTTRASPSIPSARPIPTPPRSPPVPPGATPSGSHPLTAAEEKARLKAKFETEDQVIKTNGNVIPSPMPAPLWSPPLTNGHHPHSISLADRVSSAPPPLMPRPPKEYIQETQEEDLRTHARLQAIDKEIAGVYRPVNAELVPSSYNSDIRI